MSKYVHRNEDNLKLKQSQMDTFNPSINDFIAYGQRSSISDSKSPNSKFGSLYLQKEAFE